MNFRALVVFFWACLIGTAAVAGEERQMHIEIAVDGMPAVDDMHGTHGRHEVRIIKKEVDVAN